MPSTQDLIRQAALLEQAGRQAEAIAAYERLLAGNPNLPDSWFNLARLHRAAREPEAALAAYQTALERGITGPEEVHLNRGVIYADDLLRPDDAERELRTALELNPRYVPALVNLANLAEDRGRKAEAINLYERILAIDPDCLLALARYGTLKAVSGPDDPLIGTMRAALASPSASHRDKADVAFGLGAALDRCQAYEEAFAAYQTANAFSRQAGGARAVYDRAAQEALVDQLCAVFTPERVAVLRTNSTATPVFICGMFRSGSTLTEQILAAHPRVTPGGELDLLPRMVKTRLKPFPAAMRQASPAVLAELAQDYQEAVAKLFPGAELVTDKRPDNFLYIGLIKTLWPNAKIVHTTRDPLDNCLSLYFLNLSPEMAYALDLADAAHYYRQYQRLMTHWELLFGEDIFDFGYDDLVASPRPQIARLLAFCGLEWDDACLDFHRLDNAVKTASVWQVRQPLYARSAGRWRNYEAHLGDLRAYLLAEAPG
ncbi:MAG: tetratricopeptide repeat-containing sulfotransferase family protein [Caulobacteraceae bacterium]